MPGGNIFLSYRREDTEGYARLLYKSLDAHFPGCVFRDVSGLAPGAEFVREIERKLATCHVLLVLMGKDWLDVRSKKDPTRRRLDDPRDWVRLEVATGLRRREITVIPVLVEGATMPDPSELPDDLRQLPYRNWVTINDRGGDDDFRPLVSAIEQKLGVRRYRPEPPPPVNYPPDRGTSPWKIFALITTLGLGSLLILVLVLGAYYGGQQHLVQPQDDPEPVTPGVYPPGNTPPGKDGGEVFDPAGQWRVVSPDNPMLYTVYWLNADRRLRFETMTTGGQLWMAGQGTWDYEPDGRVLTVAGQMANGQGFRNTVQILGRDGDRYAAHDLALGRIILERIR